MAALPPRGCSSICACGFHADFPSIRGAARGIAARYPRKAARASGGCRTAKWNDDLPPPMLPHDYVACALAYPEVLLPIRPFPLPHSRLITTPMHLCTSTMPFTFALVPSQIQIMHHANQCVRIFSSQSRKLSFRASMLHMCRFFLASHRSPFEAVS
mmetsp:Transcript_14884/g.45479  ORF Transcript_14884/g.45479 Transcript_14884/m.45479 type:complete len:157 (-) Transcript_14884:70-540(-)|eukprot:scaffold129180_cov27-Tisochrysis_lutea.AAC.1